MKDRLRDTLRVFAEGFDQKATAAASAPGRVEILGNHTDYNGGYVMAAAIDRSTIVAGSVSTVDTIELVAADLGQETTLSSNRIMPDSENEWANYVLGVVDELQKSGVDIGGFKAVITTDVPIGAGLSSSAALEVATALLIKQLYPFDMDTMAIAQLCQRAENKFVGVSSGLLDQFSSAFGAADCFLFLDCTTLEHEQMKLARTDLALVICDSLAKHSLVGGDYNTRRAECMAAAQFFGKEVLRDVAAVTFDEGKWALPDNQRKRAQHVLDENQRVLDAREAIIRGDIIQLGRLMSASHQSSRYLFENSTPELDFLVDTATGLPGCLGARLTGGGWGGATVNLVERDTVEEFNRELSAAYQRYTGKAPTIFVSAIGDGARIVPVAE